MFQSQHPNFSPCFCRRGFLSFLSAAWSPHRRLLIVQSSHAVQNTGSDATRSFSLPRMLQPTLCIFSKLVFFLRLTNLNLNVQSSCVHQQLLGSLSARFNPVTSKLWEVNLLSGCVCTFGPRNVQLTIRNAVQKSYIQHLHLWTACWYRTDEEVFFGPCAFL